MKLLFCTDHHYTVEKLTEKDKLKRISGVLRELLNFDSKRRRRRRGATMEMNLFLLLPMEIAEDLFSRVPFDSIIQCKVVCKSLRDLVNHLSFVQEHHKSSMHQKGYLFRLCDSEPPGFHYGEYKEEVTRFNLTTKPFISRSITNHHHPFADATQWCIVGSCKGLICLRNILHHERGTGHDDMYVCNPYTSEYVKLPKSHHQRPDQPHDVKIAYGFGYLRITGEYKVIRIYYHHIHHHHHRESLSSSGYVEVYTLGSSTGWRSIGEIMHKLYREDPYGKESQNNSYGVLVKALGALYWITKKQNLIISFDLTKEEFHVITMPPVKIVCLSVLAVLGGRLCVTIDVDDHTHIWVMINKDCSCPWVEKFRIPWRNDQYNYPLAELENGKILFHWNKLIRFDAIPYAKSSVSLKKITYGGAAAAAAAARNRMEKSWFDFDRLPRIRIA